MTVTRSLAATLAGSCRLLTGVLVRDLGAGLDGRPTVLYANHTSHLDFVLLWSILPGPLRCRTRPVAARDYWSRGALRRWLASDLFRAVLVERAAETRDQKVRQVELMADVLDQRESLILFPEGTRGEDGEPAPFRSGLYHLARLRPEVPLVPVRLENLNRVLPKGEVLPVPFLCRLTLGTPVFLAEGEEKAEFLERTRQALVRLGMASEQEGA